MLEGLMCISDGMLDINAALLKAEEFLNWYPYISMIPSYGIDNPDLRS